MIQRLAGLLLLLGLAWLVSRILRVRPRKAPVRRDVARPEGEMVRDRVCNTFLPESSALASTIAGETHYFCSERCRRQFLAGAPITTTTVS